MGQTEIRIDMIQRQLLPPALLALAQRIDTPPHRRDMLPDGQVEALHKRRVDLPAAGREHLLDRLEGAKHDAVCHADQPAPPYGLDHLRIEQLRQRHPARLGVWPFVLAAGRLHPLAEMGEERCGILFEAVGQEEWYAARG